MADRCCFCASSETEGSVDGPRMPMGPPRWLCAECVERFRAEGRAEAQPKIPDLLSRVDLSLAQVTAQVAGVLAAANDRVSRVLHRREVQLLRGALIQTLDVLKKRAAAEFEDLSEDERLGLSAEADAVMDAVMPPVAEPEHVVHTDIVRGDLGSKAWTCPECGGLVGNWASSVNHAQHCDYRPSPKGSTPG